MYERFTDRARKAMQLANQEAQRFNHEYIGTEHILLALVKEGTGVAAHVLKNLDIDLRKIRLEVEKMAQAGPDMITMGTLPWTPLAKKVLENAIEESRLCNHDYVGTEHLLLGLLRENEGVAAQVLRNLGLRLQDVRAVVLKLLGQDDAEGAEALAASPASRELLDEIEAIRHLDIYVPEPTAMQVFLAWEKLRLLYNAVLVIVAAVIIHPLGLVLLAPFLFEGAVIANLGFCAGSVAEGYMAWLGVPRMTARLLVFCAGTIAASVATVEYLNNHFPAWP